MGWEALIPLITQYGIPYAFEVWKIISTSEKPTEAQWQALLALSQKPLSTYIAEAEVAKAAEAPKPPPF